MKKFGLVRYLVVGICLLFHSASPAQNSVEDLVQKMEAFKFKNWDSVAHYANKILQLTNENQLVERGLAYLYLGVSTFEKAGKYDSAKGFYDRALPLFEKAGDSLKLATLYNNYGVTAKVRADYETALTYFFKANDLLGVDTTNNLHTTVLMNIGDVFVFMGKSDDAEKYLQLSYKEALTRQDSLKIAQIVGTLGNLYNSRQAYDEAIAYYKESLVYLKPYATDSSFMIMNIGVVYHFKGDLKTAISYYTKAIDVANNFNSPRNAALCNLNIGEALISLHDAKAVNYLNRAIALADEHQLKRILRNGYQLLATYYEQVQDLSNALMAHKKYEKFKDEIINSEALEKIDALNIKFNTAEKEKQIASQELEIERQQASILKQRNQKIAIALSLGFIVLLAGLIFLRLRMKEKARIQEAIIAEKERGLKVVFEATEQERARISKDLHDGIGQQLSGVKMQLESLELQDESLQATKEKIVENLSQAAQEVRQISHQMMPRALEEAGLVPALEDLFNKMFANSVIRCSFDHQGVDERFPKDIELSLYRITQELINNIIKHANAQQVGIQLYKFNNKLVMTIEDDGVGFDVTSKSDGHGLLNIKSRIETVNGNVEFESNATSETVITLSVPLTT